MAQPIEQRSADSATLVNTAYQWLATAFSLLVVMQAFLGSRGFFDGNAGFITVHELLANTMFLVVIVQTVLAWSLYTKHRADMFEIGMNVLLVVLTIAQIGLGYSTRNGESFATTVSLHIPNGVLMMGVATVVTMLAWRRPA